MINRGQVDGQTDQPTKLARNRWCYQMSTIVHSIFTDRQIEKSTDKKTDKSAMLLNVHHSAQYSN
jgi:hypothetical protein